jgi:hypothetical protein
MVHPLRLSGFALGLALIGCSPEPAKPAAETGLKLHQTVILAHAGETGERKVEVLEDARITDTLRPLLWGGSKEAEDFLALPAIAADKALIAAMRQGPLRRGVVRLVDHAGQVLHEYGLDCELGEISTEALPQGGGTVWTMADDCSTGGGDYAGPITHFFTLANDRLAWQGYIDETGERAALTVVAANRIAWRFATPARADDIREVSSHPDFDDPRFKSLKPADPMPGDLPLVTDYIRYHYDGNSVWVKHVHTEKNLSWSIDRGFPAADNFSE